MKNKETSMKFQNWSKGRRQLKLKTSWLEINKDKKVNKLMDQINEIVK